jgi:hypothetical protein
MRSPELRLPADQTDLVGRWRGADGRVLPDGTDQPKEVLVIRSEVGSTSCTSENVTVMLDMSWPPGSRLDGRRPDGGGESQRYVRDARSVMRTEGQSDFDTALPSQASLTGIHRAGNRLYAITSDPSAIWIQRSSGRVERWARLPDREGCG